MAQNSENIIVKYGDRGFAVEDVQRRLAKIGYLMDSEVDSIFGDNTRSALTQFCLDNGVKYVNGVNNDIWVRLVDASFALGDRSLYLNMPYFHGNDVKQLQMALGALGFSIRNYDGIFGTSTEQALRRFQINMGLPSDGIAGSATYEAINKLKFAWSHKDPVNSQINPRVSVIWRSANVLEQNELCIFGVDKFTRDVSRRISNLSRATNPFSKVLCSEQFSVAPSNSAVLVQLIAPDEDEDGNFHYPKARGAVNVPLVHYLVDGENDSLSGYEGNLAKRLIAAFPAAKSNDTARIQILLPGKNWNEAGFERTAQHFAITILDSICEALDKLND